MSLPETPKTTIIYIFDGSDRWPEDTACVLACVRACVRACAPVKVRLLSPSARYLSRKERSAPLPPARFPSPQYKINIFRATSSAPPPLHPPESIVYQGCMYAYVYVGVTAPELIVAFLRTRTRQKSLASHPTHPPPSTAACTKHQV